MPGGTIGLRRRHAGAIMLAIALVVLSGPVLGEPRHGLAIYGDPKYPSGFSHFDYVNPDAPRGGALILAALGGFDTLNPFTVKGVAAAGLGYLFSTLMVPSEDEPFSEYGLVAESVELPDDRSWVAFNLRPQARFHDGRPITAADVVFTFETLVKTHPFYGGYYANVAKVEAESERRVLFTFKPGDNRELPLIIGQMPVLPRHYWQNRDFTATTLEPPLGSGPYRIAALTPGRTIVYERVADWWGDALPVNVGRYNVARIRYDYYLDPTVALEAFKAGLIDFRQENIAKNWASAYDMREVQTGLVRKEEIPNQLPAGMQGFVYNTRRPVFADPRVRAALAYAFDFTWANQNLFHGAYKRTDSYFENSDLAAHGLPDPAQLAILEPLRDQIPPEVFDKAYRPPEAANAQDFRRNLLTAQRMLEQAGWVLREAGDRVRVNARTGQPLSFELLLDSPSFERVGLMFVQALKRLGVEARVRTVDTAQYQNRIQNFDFDMTVNVWGQSLSPGNEQRNFWSSAAADQPGSENLAGIKSPAVDRLIDRLIAATSRAELRASTAALDRVLLWSHYVIPHWHSGVFRVAYWNKLRHPDPLPPYSLSFESWWIDPKAMADTPPHRNGAVAGETR